MGQIRRASGVTLIELMLTLTVVGIMLGIAIPSFTAFFRGNRAEVQYSSLVSSLGFARAEAVRGGAQVRMTPLTAGAWEDGWRIWIDTNSNGSYDSSDTELRRHGAFGGDATLSSGAATEVVFDRLGSPVGVAVGGTIVFSYRLGADYCKLERDITINHLGRVMIERRTCP